MSSDTGRPRVLVVDDDPRILEALRRALTLKGFGVSTADGGQAALSLLGLGAPDVLVLDVAMPDVDGIEVCTRLREAGDRTPVLMLTAGDAVADRVIGSRQGPTTTWSSPSRSRSWSRGCGRCCGARPRTAGRPCCASPT
jgi:DNA-binding response OmpR family regulator